MEIYCDNAATTALDPEVIEAILPFFTASFGNPSSTHWAGRRVKDAIDHARKTVAKILNASPDEIYFTSGATEAINLAISGAIRTYDINHVVTSKIEHKAVLQTILQHEKSGDIETSFVKLDERGNVDLYHLENLLRANPRTLISLMHGNNEIGNLTDIQAIYKLAQRYNSIFFTDTTQTIGKQWFDLSQTPVDFLVGSAHKFHGPKGAGFIYINKKHRIEAQIFGGGQEKGQRGGTENVTGIVGLAKALEVAYRDLDANHIKVSKLKQYMVSKLAISGVHGICYNGESHSLENSLVNILNVSFPCLTAGSLVKCLDKLGIAVSGGSACSSQGSSHVITALPCQKDKENVRFSFSKFNTFDEIDHIVQAIADIYNADPVTQKYQSRFRFELTH
ncbi:cysteine desulfurase family protein [Dyadobacter fanqingshengii]|uniref:cysteine desulfurase n=1 Tax=Dyadobacter fanqingshengii TaxID=2906443 RepID=A0A9X1PAJ9_9BACT|nr:cysteine desulfurase family protein [Dyadobacter fanqingshengii]MCF0041701.1 cysteine desulfurase [Dyadobacter fanqingshengii]USJ36585.1 cysteine desulfurase [Dyadobacter fanqingshengii]